MYQNKIWKGLLIALGVVALWFTFQSLYLVYEYFSLNSATTTQAIKWAVRESSNEIFIIEGNYQFQVEGSEYRGKSRISDEKFRNEWAAYDVLKKEPITIAKVWYSSWNPKNSSLQKNFPVKECVSTVLLWAIFIYFFCLGRYIAKTVGSIRE